MMDASAQEEPRLLGLEALARQALDSNRELIAAREGLNVAEGKVTYAGVAEAFGMDFHPPEQFVK